MQSRSTAALTARSVIEARLAIAGALCASMTIGAARAQPPAEPVPEPSEQSSPQASPPGNEASAAEQSLPQLSPTDPFPPTGAEAELELIRPGIALKKTFDELAAETNIRFGIAHTMLLQQATGGPGDRTAAGGDLDIYAKWTAIGAGTKDTGILVGSTEYRYQIGDLTPSALGGQIGTLIPTTNGFNERTFTVKEAYWDQRLLDDHLRFAIGRVDPENLFGGHRLQSANTFFMYKAFSSNVTVAYPGAGPTAAVQVKPVDWAYITTGICNANATTTTMSVDSFFDDREFFTFLETGITPTYEGVGTGRYRLAFWHIDARENAGKPSDLGFTISLDQDFGEALTAFARYGNADGEVTGVTNSVQAGVGIRDVLGKENMLGVAGAWSESYTSGERDEKVVEVFQRFQITETIQFTVGVETIFDPSNAPDDDVLGVFSARLRFSF